MSDPRPTGEYPPPSGDTTGDRLTAGHGLPATSAEVTGPPAGTGDADAWPQVPGYAVEAELGRGGMGVVYKARHLRLNRPAALKVILGGPLAAPANRVRFLVEAEAVAALAHPHVVQLYEFGQHAGQPFFALEFVGG